MEDGIEVRVNPCSAETLAARQEQNRQIEAASEADKKWHEYESAAAYRKAHSAASFNKHARTLEIESTHGAHKIPLRCIKPSTDELSVTVVSVEYRLAPEHPFPAAGEDCLDAAMYALSQHGQSKLGGPLHIIGGESAGSYLAVWTTLQLRHRGIDVRTEIPALVCSYGIYDLNYTPSVHQHTRNVVLSAADTISFIDTAFPFPSEARRDAKISTIYADLRSLPPALFMVGTVDPLIDDSIFMAAKWSLAGNSAILKIVREAFHGFTLIPSESTEEGLDEIFEFVRAHVKP
ncbi:hypothetical protein SLS56_012074 [Neofusicoccum ribis]|uniref:Alpha/beta hydrolase fold-3 domain-containing protein n=1 Tax=Neofusicoccum ribis TaxID=45134 RepID=A0ABR3SA63_9PEZI